MNRHTGIVLLLALCAGCAAGPDFKRPDLPEGAGFARESPAPGTKVIAEWWTIFGSSEIDALVKRGIDSSPGLAAARAALVASEASLKAGNGVFYPEVDLGANALRQRVSPFRLGGAGAGSVFTLLTLGAGVSYTIDIFGGNRRAVEKLAAGADYQRALRDGTFLTLTGNLVNTAIAQSAYASQLSAMGELVALQRRQVALAEAQWRAGTVTYASVLSARAQLAGSEAAVPVVRQRLAAATDLLATLSGKTPAEWSSQAIDLRDVRLPVELPASLPSELVRQRPDILAAEAGLHVASAQVGIATAALYPNVALGATSGVQGPNASVLGTPNSRYWSWGPSVNVPVFSGFSGVHAREAARAQYEQAYAEYRQTVVNAFGQVADALQALRHDAQAEAAQQEALDLALQQRRLAAANREAGLASEAQENAMLQQVEAARINLIQVRALRLQDGTALCLALGRPWAGEGK